MLLSTEDIRATDAELSAIALRKVLKRSEMLFIVSFSCIHFRSSFSLLHHKNKKMRDTKSENFSWLMGKNKIIRCPNDLILSTGI